MNEQEIRELLNKFMKSWGMRDVNKILALMTADSVYRASAGPEPGTTFRGAKEIREGLAAMFAHDYGSGSEVTVSNLFIAGNKAAWEWSYRWPEEPSRREEVGCDFFEISEGKISLKNAFKKVLS